MGCRRKSVYNKLLKIPFDMEAINNDRFIYLFFFHFCRTKEWKRDEWVTYLKHIISNEMCAPRKVILPNCRRIHLYVIVIYQNENDNSTATNWKKKIRIRMLWILCTPCIEKFVKIDRKCLYCVRYDGDWWRFGSFRMWYYEHFRFRNENEAAHQLKNSKCSSEKRRCESGIRWLRKEGHQFLVFFFFFIF